LQDHSIVSAARVSYPERDVHRAARELPILTN